jgi:hypothetical protein
VKITKITIETEKLLIIRHAAQVAGWCPFCCRQTEFILLDQAALMEPAVTVQIQAWLETGKLHIWHQENEQMSICLPSLLCCFELDGNSGIRIAKEVP